jgi:arginine/ornithine transport system ATP-binding protein
MKSGVLTVKAHDIKKSFGSNLILKGISLEARKGDVLSIVGPSGSGKSTLLRCLNLLELPDHGDITVNGERMPLVYEEGRPTRISDRKAVERMRSKVSMVFQNFNLWSHMTILENIIEAPVHVLKIPKREAIEKAQLLLAKVGLQDRQGHYPSQISGGQKQRAAVARALAVDPEVILFDEPTSSLDPELVTEVLNVMTDLAKEGRTMIVVTHEMEFARDVSNSLIFIYDGRIEEQGPPLQLFNSQTPSRFKQFISSRGQRK